MIAGILIGLVLWGLLFVANGWLDLRWFVVLVAVPVIARAGWALLVADRHLPPEVDYSLVEVRPGVWVRPR